MCLLSVNVGSGQAYTGLELMRAVFAAARREPHIEFIDVPEMLRHQYQYDTCALLVATALELSRRQSA